MHNELISFSSNPGEITLSGFIFMKEKTPDDFEVCLIVEITGHLSAGCWLSDSDGKGKFKQRRGGIIDADYVLAWFPIEKVSIERNIWWDPEYNLIAEFWDCFRVFAKDGESMLTFEYTGGAKERVFFHMDINTGDIPEMNKTGYEDVKDIRKTLNDWYQIFKGELLEEGETGNYKALSNNGDFD